LTFDFLLLLAKRLTVQVSDTTMLKGIATAGLQKEIINNLRIDVR
jgi:hypothetical protein